MRRISIIPAAISLLVLSAGAAQAATTADALLSGRAAGKPVNCINRDFVLDTQTLDDHAIYYRMSGRSDYIQRPRQCPILDSRRTYVLSVPSSQICSGDAIRVMDSARGNPLGACLFDDFVPYAKRK